MSSNDKPTTSIMGFEIRELLFRVMGRIETMTPEQFAMIPPKYIQELWEYLNELKAGLEEDNPTIHEEES
jgi:hypothetical protein